MTDRIAAAGVPALSAHAPRSVTLLSPILKFLLTAGVPLGPNRFVTIRGRKSGLPRSTPLAVIQVDGRRWVWSPWGEVQWVRNLRAAGRAIVRTDGRQVEVNATELGSAERIAFFRDILGPLARSTRGGMTFARVVDGVDLDDPEGAAQGRVVFELRPLQ